MEKRRQRRQEHFLILTVTARLRRRRVSIMRLSKNIFLKKVFLVDNPFLFPKLIIMDACNNGHFLLTIFFWKRKKIGWDVSSIFLEPSTCKVLFGTEKLEQFWWLSLSPLLLLALLRLYRCHSRDNSHSGRELWKDIFTWKLHPKIWWQWQNCTSQSSALLEWWCLIKWVITYAHTHAHMLIMYNRGESREKVRGIYKMDDNIKWYEKSFHIRYANLWLSILDTKVQYWSTASDWANWLNFSHGIYITILITFFAGMNVFFITWKIKIPCVQK